MWAVEVLCVEGVAEAIGGEDVHMPVAHEGGRRRDRIEDALDARPQTLRRRSATPAQSRVHRAGEIEEVRPLGVVELQRARKRLEDALGDTRRAASLEPRVVIDADPGQQRDFLPAQSWDAPRAAVGAQTCLLRRDLRAPRDQVLADLAAGVHGTSVTRR